METAERLLTERFGRERVLLHEPMRAHTTMRVGGAADLFFSPASQEEILFALEVFGETGTPCCLIGNGSNLIVRDGGIRGAVLALGADFSGIERAGARLRAQAGAQLSRVAAEALKSSLTGLEFASGIPGSVGGGVAMNAGAYGGELKDVLCSARVLLDGRVKTWATEDLQMGYRASRVLREGGIVLEAEFLLKAGNPDAIRERMEDLNGRRRDKQPLNFPSAGSTFKRPEGYYAGALIEEAGLKGFSIGGARVSPKHAGFVINTGNATARDVLNLIGAVQEKVFARSGVRLETEVRVLGED